MRVPSGAHVRVASGLAAALLLIGIGTIANATIPDQGVIHGCYQKRSGDLRVVDATGPMDASQACRRSETPLDWSQEGPQGATGPSDGWDAQAGGTVPTGGEDVLLGGGVADLPPGNYLLSGFASWPPLDSGSASVFCNLQAAGTDVNGSTSGGFGSASAEGGGTVSMMGALEVGSGTASVEVQCRQLSGTEVVFAHARIHVIRVGTLH